MPQRGDVTVDLAMGLATVAETITVRGSSPAGAVQLEQLRSRRSNASSSTRCRSAGATRTTWRNLDPSIVNTPGTTAAGTARTITPTPTTTTPAAAPRRANAVLLDGVALGASYKTAYTPSMDAVEEITVSKSSVDAENGNSLGGLISLNMKSGTNTLRGSAYMFFRDPSMNSIGDPTITIAPGQDTSVLRGTKLKMYGGTVGGAIKQNRIFSFTSFEDWNDKRPLTIVRTVPTELERARRLQPVAAERPRLRPSTTRSRSTLDSAGRVVRQPFASNQIPQAMIDPVAREDAERHSAAQQGRQHRQLAGQPLREHRLLELLAARRRQLQRHVQDVRALRPVQGRPLSAEPDRRRLLPA